MKGLHIVTWILLVIGGLNWLLVGLFDWGVGNLVGMALGRIIYVLVGLSAIYEIATHKQNCKLCGASIMAPSSSVGSMGRSV